MSEVEPHSTAQSQVGHIVEAETGCLGLDEPQESMAQPTSSPEPVWETASLVQDSTPMEFELGGETFRLEASVPKANSSSEQAAKRDEDPGAEFRQNVVFMRQTISEAAVPQPTPVQPKAVLMSALQAEEASFSLFVNAKFSELSDELAGTTGSTKNTSGEGLA